ncbi:MAG: hypothetical protein AWU58_794 [Methanohalophilus sp. T328-1]|jgi:uncharacterized protein YjbK|uniref:hypothetical protein n=1 Tax=unclassified Methanohalophilus TaxID=2636082 RepID=UPI00079834D7|nr:MULTISPECIES: hypothetical protein [unclassified Methanohalophilus]KXS46131.1 MAG: hypothetical protein AWU58_794 [Methanohalophilus sp. T328-1]OBZ36011.1 MAG: hypothetical protein A9957_05105 [Methanohalophilus sp. DAL1]RXG34690.1 hypothetical protein CI957_743 [Methanohalophilus sp. WG1-DM]
MQKIYHDRRAVSTAIGFILTFVITIMVFMSVMNSSYVMMDRNEHSVMREQFEIHGSSIALQLTKIDTTINLTRKSGGNVEEIQSDIVLPMKIADEYYYMQISNQTHEIIFESDGIAETRVQIPYELTTTDIESATINSVTGEHYFFYNSTTEIIEVH